MSNFLIGLLVLPIALSACFFTVRRIQANILQKREAQRLLDEERRQWVRYTVHFEDGSYAFCRRRRTPEDDLPKKWPEFLYTPDETQK